MTLSITAQDFEMRKAMWLRLECWLEKASDLQVALLAGMLGHSDG